MSTRRSRRYASIFAPLALVGCSVIATADAPQCANENDCFVKFGAGFTCQTGGCVSSSAVAAPVSPVVSTLKDCRATQECVAALGEGFLCRRDRNDPQKKGVCQQLTPASDCQVLGDYKDDNVILLGALLPGKSSPALGTAVRTGLVRAVNDWLTASRELQAQPAGADRVEPPRPFAIIACSEDVAQADLRNIYLNSGTRLIIGPSVMTAQTQTLTTELTNARLVFVSPTSIAAPSEGANIGSYYFRVAGSETSFLTAAKGAGFKPTHMVRPTAYVGIGDKVQSEFPGIKQTTYDDPGAISLALVPADSLLVLDEGPATTALARVGKPGSSVVLPAAIPDTAEKLPAGTPPASAPKSLRAARKPSLPSPPFAANAFGDAEAYDAVYLSLAALAAVDPAVSPEDVKEDVLRAALVRASTPGGTLIDAQTAAIKDMLVALRTSPTATITLNGATGSLAITDQTTSHPLTVCTVGPTGCN